MKGPHLKAATDVVTIIRPERWGRMIRAPARSVAIEIKKTGVDGA